MITTVPQGGEYWDNSAETFLYYGATIPTPGTGDSLQIYNRELVEGENTLDPEELEALYEVNPRYVISQYVYNAYYYLEFEEEEEEEEEQEEGEGGEEAGTINPVGEEWIIDSNLNGWSFHIEDNTMSVYTIIDNIQNKPIVNLDFAFISCDNLTTMPTIPSTVTSMSYCFAYCSLLTILSTIPNSVINMSYCFFECGSLANFNINLPTSVQNLEGCFQNCSSLLNLISIPSTVTNIAHIYDGCTAVSGVIYFNNEFTTYNNPFDNTEETIYLLLGQSVSFTCEAQHLTVISQYYNDFPDKENLLSKTPQPELSDITIQRCDSDGSLNSVDGTSAKVTINYSYFQQYNNAIESINIYIDNQLLTNASNVWKDESNNTIILPFISNLFQITLTTILNLNFSLSTTVNIKIELIDSFGESANIIGKLYPPLHLVDIYQNDIMGLGRSVTSTDRMNSGVKTIRCNLNYLSTANQYIEIDTSEPLYTLISGNSTFNSCILNAYEVTVVSNNINQGTVSGNGIYTSDSTVTLTAFPKDGYEFDHWLLPGDVSYTLNPQTLQVSSDMTITAYFTTVS